jgi:FKBP-type peptidyl-prolyl cis-trans isomerase
VGTEKRERQKAARLEKISAQATAAKREKTRGTAIRIAVAAVVVLGVLFGVSQLMGDDDDSDESETAASDSCPVEAPSASTQTVDTSTFSDPAIAGEVLTREPPAPEPPPDDTPADALEASTLIEGEGAEAAVGSTVVVHYAGVLSDCTMFDESWSTGQTFPVTLGQGSVIAGWDEGLVGAKAGERRHLVIGAQNAYGSSGQGSIPPDAPLAFDVDVIDVQPPADPAATTTTAPADAAATTTTAPADAAATTTTAPAG